MVNMRGVALDSRQKSLVLVGIVLAAIGFGLHFMAPATGRSGYVVLIPPMETTVEPISLTPGSTEQNFQFYFLGPAHSNLSIYFLDDIQYQTYQSGTSLSNISQQVVLDEEGSATYVQLVDSNQIFYLIFVSNHSELLTFSYYYSLYSATYFSSATIGFIGIFLIIIGFSWYFSGWKRYFLLGLEANLVFFLIRIFTLTSYSLGLPDLFLNVLTVELYNDYQFFYLSWIPNLWEGAWAYSMGLPNYLYPPLWIYTVGLFGASPPWVPGAILFAFNVATGILVYKIAKLVSEDEKTSIVAMMIYLLNPITVAYGSFMWLNPTPSVFFVTLSFYLVLTNKAEFSIASIAVATLYKQFAVIFFPILALYLIKQRTDRTMKTSTIQFLKHTFIYIVIIGLVSLPFLIVSPHEYYTQLIESNRLNFERLTYFIPDLWMPVHFNTFFLWVSGSSVLTNVIAWLIYNYVFLIICGLVVYGAFAALQRTQGEVQEFGKRDLFMNAILWSFIAVLCVQTFFPRGVYKFYLLILIPFAALLFDFKNLRFQSKEAFSFKPRHLFVPLMIVAIFLCYRFIYLWIIVAWAWFYLIQSGEASRIRDGIQSFLRRIKPAPSSESETIESWEEIYSE